VDEILIVVDGKRFPALLHEDKAPMTCKAIVQRLPISGKVIHARWSGEAIWLPMEEQRITVELENQTCYPSRGQILFYPGFVSERELLIPYGATMFASKSGILPGNHFATILEGLEELAAIGKKVLWEGAKDISISIM